jgi:uncharacterized surface protein with fasciclin (FAS1) repeats
MRKFLQAVSPATKGFSATDVLASNGVVHVIDKVIVPGLDGRLRAA